MDKSKINKLFDSIKNKEIDYEKREKATALLTDNFNIEKLKILQLEFAKYFHKVLAIYEAGSVVKLPYSRKRTLLDPTMEVYDSCYHFEARLSQLVLIHTPDIPQIETVSVKSNIDLNLWNENAKKLFEYLIENYHKAKGRQKYINIYHFLKNTDSTNERKEIKFHYSVDDYKKLIKSNYSTEWIKTNKPTNYDNQLVILNSLYIEWKSKFK